MSHYICRGENCRTTGNLPSVCLEPNCQNRYRLLEECNCPHGKAPHQSGSSISDYKTGVRIKPINFGIALGIVSSVMVFMLGIISMSGPGSELVDILSVFYFGYNSTFLGSIAGGLWGFVDGLIIGALVAWLYNKLGQWSPR